MCKQEWHRERGTRQFLMKDWLYHVQEENEDHPISHGQENNRGGNLSDSGEDNNGAVMSDGGEADQEKIMIMIMNKVKRMIRMVL
jgi:hypothetical protein